MNTARVVFGWTPQREEPPWKRVLRWTLGWFGIAAIAAFHIVLSYYGGRIAAIASSDFVDGVTHLVCAIGMLLLVAAAAASAYRYLFTAPDLALFATMPFSPRALFVRRLRLWWRHETAGFGAVVVAIALAASIGSGQRGLELLATLVLAVLYFAAASAAGVALAFHDRARRVFYAVAGITFALVVTVGVSFALAKETAGPLIEWLRSDPLRAMTTFGAAAPMLVLLVVAAAVIAVALPRYTMLRIAEKQAAAIAPPVSSTERPAERDATTEWVAKRWGRRRLAVLGVITWLAQPEAVWPRTKRALRIGAVALAIAFALRWFLPAPWMYVSTMIVGVTFMVLGFMISSDAGSRDHDAIAGAMMMSNAPAGPLVGRSPYAMRGLRQHPVIATLPLRIEEVVGTAIRFQLTGVAVWLAVSLLIAAVYPYDRRVVLGIIALVGVAITLGVTAGPVHTAASYIMDRRRSRRVNFGYETKRRLLGILAGVGMVGLFVIAEMTGSHWVLAAMPLYLLLVAALNTLVAWRRTRWWHAHHLFDAEYPRRVLPAQRW